MYFDDGSWLSRRGRLSRPRSSLLESTASSSELSVSPTIEREGAGVVLAGHQEAPHDQHAERGSATACCISLLSLLHLSLRRIDRARVCVCKPLCL